MRILDLFCGAGGAAMGLHQAFPEAEIFGVDIKQHQSYPFEFFLMDWRGAFIQRGWGAIGASADAMRFNVWTTNTAPSDI